MPALCLQRYRVDERHCRRCRQQANVPSFALGWVDKAGNVSSGGGCTGYDIKDFAHAVTPERSARDWSAVGPLRRDRSIRFDIRLRATGRQFTSRGASRSASRSFPRDSSRFPHWLYPRAVSIRRLLAVRGAASRFLLVEARGDLNRQSSLAEAHECRDMVKPHVGRPEGQPVVV